MSKAGGNISLKIPTSPRNNNNNTNTNTTSSTSTAAAAATTDQSNLTDEQFVARYGHVRPKQKLLHSPRKYFDSADWTLNGGGCGQPNLPHRTAGKPSTATGVENQNNT
eukprot:TRINITY_DN2391_c2_g1_i1.p1 TRINITY_DN2391_c2_g1~~TRINITY_DN2391_c2_g1_i1.p1  ORF type:complete len:109 (+),score=15.47 TRINITY_DN2391_c2_g1_i1:253-579(+)